MVRRNPFANCQPVICEGISSQGSRIQKWIFSTFASAHGFFTADKNEPHPTYVIPVEFEVNDSVNYKVVFSQELIRIELNELIQINSLKY